MATIEVSHNEDTDKNILIFTVKKVGRYLIGVNRSETHSLFKCCGWQNATQITTFLS